MSSLEPNIGTRSDSAGAQTQLHEQRYQDDVAYIARRVKVGECILFLGSAIHVEAPEGSRYHYPPEKRPLIGKDLSELLATECKYPVDEDKENLPRVAWYHEWYGSRARLVGAVRNAVHRGREPSPVLRGLARLGFPLVVTTNYDQLYEQALIELADEGESFRQFPSKDHLGSFC